jgi:23S rRNA (cytidine1920-2'-O)/16S rRNA (cytidine1409-2'-O)-methyltransferase
MPSDKIRVDQLLVVKNLAESRQRAKALILAGKVFAGDLRIEKPGALVSPNLTLRIQDSDLVYVSRGGLKLQAALDGFQISVEKLICLDIGASTGGFSDCLLQRGAARVFAVDVGYGQLAWKLRQDPRIVVLERSNIRYLPETALPCRVDLVTIDVSFISLRIVVPAVEKFMSSGARIIALIKPQFEVGKAMVGKGGVVRDPSLHRQVIDELSDFFSRQGFSPESVIPSPVLGPKGNQEFLMLLHRGQKPEGQG